MRYPITQAEKVRRKVGKNPEDFSVFLGFSFRTYPEALKRGHMTYNILFRIANVCGVKLKGLMKDGTPAEVDKIKACLRRNGGEK